MIHLRHVSFSTHYAAKAACLLLAAALAALGLVVSDRGPVRAQDAQSPPRKIDWLVEPKFDKLILSDGSVVEIEPLAERPFPKWDQEAYEKAKRLQERLKARRKSDKAEPILKGAEPKAEPLPDPKLQFRVKGGGDIVDFEVNRASIRRVEHFEEMLLQEVDRNIKIENYDRAFELVLRLNKEAPKWPGVQARYHSLLFDEAEKLLKIGQPDQGMRLLAELFERDPGFPGVADRVAGLLGQRIDDLIKSGRYAQGRRELRLAEQILKSHPVLASSRGSFQQAARRLLAQTQAQSQNLTPQARLDLIRRSLEVWPALEEARSAYAQAFAAYPTLDSAVLDVPRTINSWARTTSARRVLPLLYRPILADVDEAATTGKRQDQVAESLVKENLGRKLTIRTRTGIMWSDGSRPLAAPDLAVHFLARADQDSPSYQARWSAMFDRVEAPDERTVIVHLIRPSLFAEHWLTGPAGPAHASADGWVTGDDKKRRPAGNGPFRWDAQSLDELTLAAESPDAKIKRLREKAFGDPDLAMLALSRGEVAFWEHVPPSRADEAARLAPSVRVGRYVHPAVHLIAIDGRKPILRNRTLRRGLSLAIPRETILLESVLRAPSLGGLNRLMSHPFPQGSYADAPGVKPLEHDPTKARVLIAGARRELAGVPISLTFEYPATPEARAAAPKIADAWKAAGVNVRLAERSLSELEEKLRSGEPFDLAYRIRECREPGFEAGELICPSIDSAHSSEALNAVPSPRILQLLLDLEQARDRSELTAMTQRIARECSEEFPILPLWQVEQVYAWHERLQGVPESCDRPYQGIEAWEAKPWLPQD